MNQVHEEEIPDREEIPGEENVALMGIPVRKLKPMTQEEGGYDDGDVHIKGPPPQVEDVLSPKRREGASSASEPALDMTSLKAYLDEEGTQDIGIINSDELWLKEDDDAENVVDIKKQSGSNRENAEDRNETTETVSEDTLQNVNLHHHKEFIFNVIHSNGRHDIDGKPIWNNEVYAVIAMFEGEKEEKKIFKNRGRHCAEKFMLEYLEHFKRIKKLKIFLSFSPCFTCCQRFIKFKRNRERAIEIEIVCSAIYRARRPYCLREEHTHRMLSESDHNESIKGLMELIQHGVIIRPPSGEDWSELNKMLESNLTEYEMITKIQERSKDDEEMIRDFQELKLVSDSVDSEDGVPASLDIRSLEEKMNVVHRRKDRHRKNNTPEAENPTVITREAHPAEEDKLDEATGGADVGW